MERKGGNRGVQSSLNSFNSVLMDFSVNPHEEQDKKKKRNQRKIIKSFLILLHVFPCPPNCITYNLKDTQGDKRRREKEIVLHHLDFLPFQVMTANNNVIRRAGAGKRWNAFWGESAVNAVVGSSVDQSRSGDCRVYYSACLCCFSVSLTLLMSLLFPCCRNALLLPRPQRRLK